MAAVKKAKKSSERLCALRTHINDYLYIRSNPSEEEVKNFVKEHNRRYHAGESGGPSGIPSFLIQDAHWFDNEADAKDPTVKGEPLDISDVQ